jgi:hypothetical protein
LLSLSLDEVFVATGFFAVGVLDVTGSFSASGLLAVVLFVATGLFSDEVLVLTGLLAVALDSCEETLAAVAASPPVLARLVVVTISSLFSLTLADLLAVPPVPLEFSPLEPRFP